MFEFSVNQGLHVGLDFGLKRSLQILIPGQRPIDGLFKVSIFWPNDVVATLHVKLPARCAGCTANPRESHAIPFALILDQTVFQADAQADVIIPLADFAAFMARDSEFGIRPMGPEGKEGNWIDMIQAVLGPIQWTSPASMLVSPGRQQPH